MALIIRKQQEQALKESALNSFETEMVEHCRKRSPRLFKVIGEEQMRRAIRGAIDRASGYHFTYQGPVRLYIELMLIFGSAFDTDPQYFWAGEILSQNKTEERQMEVAKRLHLEADRYLDEVHGPENRNVWRALKRTSTLSYDSISGGGGGIEEQILKEIRVIFPEKITFGGEPPIRELIGEGIDVANRYRLSGEHGAALMSVLMFSFGHNCADDRLYPWINRTLTDPKIVDSDGRTGRLERKARTWLDHVLDGESRRAES